MIVEDPMVEIRLQSRGKPAGAGGRRLGSMEEYFIEQLSPGDTFVFAGDVLRFEGLRETAAYVTRTNDPEGGNPQLQWRQVSAFDLPGPARARDGVEAGALGACPIRCRNG